MFIQQVISKQWLTCNIILFPKSGNLKEVGSYRGIALSVIAAKMTNTMIQNRIQPYIYGNQYTYIQPYIYRYIDPILRPNQNGFRSRRSATIHILALSICESQHMCRSHNLKAITIFADFEKALDSINSTTMLQIPTVCIPTIIIQTIVITYKDTFAKVT